MAVQTACDICGGAEAVKMKLEMEGMTTVELDVCPEHYREVREFFQKLLNAKQ